MTDRQIMTLDEIHDFGIKAVIPYIQKDGFIIENVNPILTMNPQIVAKKDSGLCFIFVRTACYPQKGDIASEKEFEFILNHSMKCNATPYIARVGIYNADGGNEMEARIPYKGAGFHVSFNGLEILTTSDKVNVLQG